MTMRRIDLQPLEPFTSDFIDRTGAFNPGALEAATAIIEQVRRDGDAALRALTEKFDGVAIENFRVPGEAIVLAGYLGLSAVLVSLFLVMARITGQDAAQSFARGFTALFAGEMAGVALGNVIDVVAGTEQTPSVVVACAGLAALYAFLFLFTERDFRALSVIARDADRFDDACSLIAAEHGLSKREAEILPFALKGRTGERIAAEFYISKSTVDTHLRRIYAKCGVHGRQELIDLGERTERRLSGR